MPTVNFYLKTKEENTGKCLIKLRFKYSGHDLVYTFGESIDPGKKLKDGNYENWSVKKQRVKSNTQTTKDGDHSLNDLLDSLEEVLQQAYKAELKNGVPLPSTLKKYLDDFRNQNKIAAEQDKSRPTLFNLIDRFVSGEIKGKKGREHREGTLDNYAACKAHLMAYQEKYNYRVDFDTITLDFFHSYTNFLKKHYTYQPGGKTSQKVKGLSHNTIAKDITFLKGFLNKAVSLGLSSNLVHKHDDFSFSEKETDAVYLKENELIDLFNFKIDNSKLEHTKDLFTFGAFTGLRFSDYSNVKPENIIKEDGDLYIKIRTQKTGELVYIPCHPIVLQIFEKYSERPNRLPKTLSNQKFNDYIKDVCKLAGMTEKGRLTTDPDKELWECISSHTARRSFATNLFLEGIEPKIIMKITGHKTEKAFNAYIRVSKLDTAKKLSAHMKKRWSEKLMRVA